MVNHHYQQGIFPQQVLAIELPDADIEYHGNFLSEQDAWSLFEQILQDTQWRQEQVTVYGKRHLTPRLSCWMGDEGLDYSYSNLTMQPVPWSQPALRIKATLEERVDRCFNSVLINYYRNGHDSNGWHSDNEPELGQDPVIASISLGAGRDFKLRQKTNKTITRTIHLEHGSLLMMRGATQRCWEHQIPKRAKANARLNLTFRTIKAST